MREEIEKFERQHGNTFCYMEQDVTESLRAEWVAEIANEVITKNHVSFNEVQELFIRNGFCFLGTVSIRHPKHQQLIFWEGWNQTAVNLIGYLLNEYPIMIEVSTDPIHYFIEGAGLQLPRARKIKAYKRDHWLPAVLAKDEERQN